MAVTCLDAIESEMMLGPSVFIALYPVERSPSQRFETVFQSVAGGFADATHDGIGLASATSNDGSSIQAMLYSSTGSATT